MRCFERYLFGTQVNGAAFVVFGVKTDDTKTPLPASLTRESVRSTAAALGANVLINTQAKNLFIPVYMGMVVE